MIQHNKIGIIIRMKMLKTVTVLVRTCFHHTKYKKRISHDKKYLVHVEQSGYNVGDLVIITQTSPYSRHKMWKIKRIVQSFSVSKELLL